MTAAAAEPQLFDPGPQRARQQHPSRRGDRVTYLAPSASAKYDHAENVRVRGLLEAHLATRMPALVNQRTGNTTAAWGRARGDFARAWVDLCLREGWEAPGGSRGTRQHRGTRYKSERDRHVDNARTALRQFLDGADKPDWMLVGIEATVCDRTGHQLPAAWYHGQRQLVRRAQ